MQHHQSKYRYNFSIARYIPIDILKCETRAFEPINNNKLENETYTYIKVHNNGNNIFVLSSISFSGHSYEYKTFYK